MTRNAQSMWAAVPANFIAENGGNLNKSLRKNFFNLIRIGLFCQVS